MSRTCDDCGRESAYLAPVLPLAVVKGGHGCDEPYHLCPACTVACEAEGEERPSQHPARSRVYGGPGLANVTLPAPPAYDPDHPFVRGAALYSGAWL